MAHISDKKSVLLITSLKLLGVVLGIGYQVVQAWLFGATRQIGVYFAAQRMFDTVRSISQAGQLGGIFLPEYFKLIQSEGKSSAIKAYWAVVNRIMLYVLALSIIAIVLSTVLPKLIIPGFTGNDQKLAAKIFAVIASLFVFEIFSAFGTMILNAERKYGRSEVVSLINMVVSIVVLILLYDRLGVWSLVASLIVGKLIDMLVLLWAMKKAGIAFIPTLSHNSFNFRGFFANMLFTLVYTIGTQAYVVATNAGLSFLPEGYFEVYNYTSSMAQRLRSVLFQPFTTVFSTSFSVMFAKKQMENVRSLIVKNTRYTIFLTVLLIGFFAVCGKDLMGTLYFGKKFTAEHVHIAYLMMIIWSSSFLLRGSDSLYRPIGTAMGFVKPMYIAWTVAQVITAAISYYVIPMYGMYGLMLTIFSNIILLSLVAMYLVGKEDKSLLFYDFKLLLQYSTVLGATGLLVYFGWDYISPEFSPSKIHYALLLFIKTSVFALLALPIMYFLRFYPLREIADQGVSKAKGFIKR